MARPTSATIHTDALRHNLSQVRARAPRSRVMAVVKADGYGHGLERVARALQAAEAFGVAELRAAERWRAPGLRARDGAWCACAGACDGSGRRRHRADEPLRQLRRIPGHTRRRRADAR